MFLKVAYASSWMLVYFEHKIQLCHKQARFIGNNWADKFFFYFACICTKVNAASVLLEICCIMHSISMPLIPNFQFVCVCECSNHKKLGNRFWCEKLLQWDWIKIRLVTDQDDSICSFPSKLVCNLKSCLYVQSLNTHNTVRDKLMECEKSGGSI